MKGFYAKGVAKSNKEEDKKENNIDYGTEEVNKNNKDTNTAINTTTEVEEGENSTRNCTTRRPGSTK